MPVVIILEELLDLIDAAYDMDPDEVPWLATLVGAAARVLDRGLGIGGLKARGAQRGARATCPN